MYNHEYPAFTRLRLVAPIHLTMRYHSPFIAINHQP